MMIAIILLITLLLFGINVNVDGTSWKEKGTDRPILVLRQDKELGVIYKYPEECFERHMSLLELFRNYKQI